MIKENNGRTINAYLVAAAICCTDPLIPFSLLACHYIAPVLAIPMVVFPLPLPCHTKGGFSPSPLIQFAVCLVAMPALLFLFSHLVSLLPALGKCSHPDFFFGNSNYRPPSFSDLAGQFNNLWRSHNCPFHIKTTSESWHSYIQFRIAMLFYKTVNIFKAETVWEIDSHGIDSVWHLSSAKGMFCMSDTINAGR